MFERTASERTMLERRLPARPRWRQRSWSLMVAGALLCSIGCSGDDGKHTISGTVTFKGEPVPAGEVRFTPDMSKGNNGPVVLARIKEGRYETPSDKGVVGGPYQLRVSGFGSAPNSKDPTASDFGRPMFPVHRQDVDLPREDHEFDIVIE